MADQTPTPSSSGLPPLNTDPIANAVDFLQIGAQLMTGAAPGLGADAVSDTMANGQLKGHLSVLQFFQKNVALLAAMFGQMVATGEDAVLPVIAAAAAPTLAEMFGGDVDAAAFADKAASGSRNAAAAALVRSFMDQIRGGLDGPIEPDDAGANRVAAAGMHAAMSGWFLTAIPEILSDFLPFEIGHIDALTRLPEEIISAMGIGRLVRGALRPLINAVATQPLTWATNIQYRPTRVSPQVAIKQYLRGAWTDAEMQNSLQIDGYRDELIDALVNDATKFEPIGDLSYRVWRDPSLQDAAVQTLRDQGYEEQTASKMVLMYGIRQLDALYRRAAESAVTAYVHGRIDAAGLDQVLGATLPSADEVKALKDIADLERTIRVVPLSPAEAEACVLANILPLADYRTALETAGYGPDAIDALELLLRWKIDKATTIAEHRQALATAKAAAAKAKTDAAALHLQTVQQTAARKALGAIGTLERAVIHGLIPASRLEAALALEYPADTVAIYLADVEQRRAAYVAAQQKAAGVAKVAKVKGLATGALRAAYLDGVLTRDQVDQQLVAGGLPAADAGVLLATWDEALKLKQAAATLHADAQARAKTKRLSLAEAELLAVAGHWTLDAFNAYLASLGFGAGDVAHLDQLVADKIAKVQAGAAVRKTTTAANTAKGLSLAQEARAVVLGQRSIGDFQVWLAAHAYSADAITALVAETETAAATAQAARARRTTAATAEDGRPVPLAEVTRAARLGLLSPQAYTAQLEARGFTPDAIALDLELLAAEIATARHPAPAAGSVASAVAASGLPTLTFATKRHVAIDGELAGRGISLSQAETAVKDKSMTLDGYQAWLEANGYAAADAELLRALLATKLGLT